MLVKIGLPELMTGSAAEEEDANPKKIDSSIVPDKNKLKTFFFIIIVASPLHEFRAYVGKRFQNHAIRLLNKQIVKMIPLSPLDNHNGKIVNIRTINSLTYR